MAISRTIIVVWDDNNSCWRSRETGVRIEGIGAPDLFKDEDRHPFDKSFTVTYEQVQKMIADAIEQYKEEDRNSHYPYATVDSVDRMVAKAIGDRTIPDFPVYFFEGNWLVTYDWTMHIIRRELTSLETQLRSEIAKPWWKRW